MIDYETLYESVSTFKRLGDAIMLSRDREQAGRMLADFIAVRAALEKQLYAMRREAEGLKAETLGSQRYDFDVLRTHINGLK